MLIVAGGKDTVLQIPHVAEPEALTPNEIVFVKKLPKLREIDLAKTKINHLDVLDTFKLILICHSNV